MKRKMWENGSKLLLTCMAAAVLLMPGTVNAASSEHIDSLEIAGRECFIYVPQSDWVGERTCTSPIFIVYGDEKYDADSARTMAQNSGLSEIAAREGSAVVFANSLGENWNAVSDKELYAAILDVFTDSTNETYVDGVAEIPNQYTGESDKKYGGTSQRVYLYGEGSGADFVAENHMMPAIEELYFEQDDLTIVMDKTPSSITLANLNAMPELEYEEIEIPAVVINGPEGTEEILAGLNPINGKYKVLTSEITDGWDSEAVKEAYNTVTGTVRREMKVIHEIPNYEAAGIKETIKTAALASGEIEYYEYIPDSADMSSEGKVPLVLIFHGGGNHAEYHAWASEWPLVAAENGFMVISVNKHVDITSERIVELVEALETEYPAIDRTRIYASGFSMGGVKSWNIGVKYPDIFAGIIPMDAGYAQEDETALDMVDNYEYIIPTFYVAGGVSPLPETPCQTYGTGDGTPNNVDEILKVVLKMNKVTENYVYNAEEEPIWGIAPTSTRVVPNETYKECELQMSEYASEDGNVYTVLCLETNKNHEVYAAETYEAWKFISRFSRNEDGSVTISSEAE